MNINITIILIHHECFFKYIDVNKSQRLFSPISGTLSEGGMLSATSS